jgi:hypothetical protein
MRIVRLSLFVVFLCLVIVQILFLAAGLKSGFNVRTDFRHLYTAGYMVRLGQGAGLYNFEIEERLQSTLVSPARALPFDHLAYEALLFVPFSFLRYNTAYFTFAVFNLLLLVAAQRLFRPYLLPLKSLGKFVPEAIFFCFLPIAIAIILGQDSILLLLLAGLAFVALDEEHDVRAGFLLSLGLFKFQLILPIVLLFVLWRNWRFVFGAAFGGVAVICLSAWITGFSGLEAFVRTIIDMSVGLSTQAQRVKYGTYPSAMPNLRGLIDTIGNSYLSAHAIQIVVVIATLLVILIASRMRPSLSLAFLVAVLVSYHGLIHDSALLAVPLGIILVESVAESNLRLGFFDILLFVCPAVLFIVWSGHYFLMAILILAVLVLWRSASTTSYREVASKDMRLEHRDARC